MTKKKMTQQDKIVLLGKCVLAYAIAKEENITLDVNISTAIFTIGYMSGREEMWQDECSKFLNAAKEALKEKVAM
jgi:hypothetical protein